MFKYNSVIILLYYIIILYINKILKYYNIDYLLKYFLNYVKNYVKKLLSIIFNTKSFALS